MQQRMERKRQKRKQLNRRGKAVIAILLLLIICLFIEMNLGTEAETAGKQSETNLSAQPLLETPKKKAMFSSSVLYQSARNKREEVKEKEQQKEAWKQLQQDRQEKSIYLTFDDGPSDYANQLLDILNQYDAKATFFLLGPNMKQHPTAVERMVNEGFGVGMHGMTHDVHQVYSSVEAPLEEMSNGQQILKEVTGMDSQLVRLPYGSVPYLTLDMRYLLDEHDFKIWDWNVDSEDWELKDRRYVSTVINGIKHVESQGEAPIVLLHDKLETIRHLPKLLRYLQKEGYQTKVLTNDLVPYTFQCNDRCYSIGKKQ